MRHSLIPIFLSASSANALEAFAGCGKHALRLRDCGVGADDQFIGPLAQSIAIPVDPATFGN